jgi:hypothetical protein
MQLGCSFCGHFSAIPHVNERQTMITVYTVKYHKATDTLGARLTVTLLDNKKTYKVPYSYGAQNAEKFAIHSTFGEDTAQLECVGRLNETTSLYAVNH